MPIFSSRGLVQSAVGPAVFLGALSVWASAIAATTDTSVSADAQTMEDDFRVTLLGTGSPIPTIDVFGPATLIEAGDQTLLIDAGRGVTQRLWQLGVALGEVDAVFLSHWHSDHTVGIPDLLMTGWLSPPYGRRDDNLTLFGPRGVDSFSRSIEQAWRFDRDIRIADELMAPDGALIDDRVIRAGEVYAAGGVTVTAIEVDHGDLIAPAYGFRVDYDGRSVVISGDTRVSANLIEAARGTNLLIHEVAAADPEVLESSEQARRIIDHHVTPEQGGEVFTAVAPELAVYSHIVRLPPKRPSFDSILAATRTTYSGPLVMGRDLMRLVIGADGVTVIESPNVTVP